MRKIFILVSIVLSILIVSGCENEEIEIEPNMINVIFDNPRYLDDSFYIEIHITNGFDEDMFIGDMDFGIYPIDSEIEVAGAGFNIDLNIEADGYEFIELEFGFEYVFISEDQLSELGYNINDLEIYFWLSE